MVGRISLICWRSHRWAPMSSVKSFPVKGLWINNVLGTFDPMLLSNDAYTMRLTATDGGGNTVFVDRQVNVGGDLKLGNFTYSPPNTRQFSRLCQRNLLVFSQW